MRNLGILHRIDDLREVWKHEAQDFSKWLAEEENLKSLSDAIGIDIVLGERESAVGKFSVDIFANEEGGNRKIIIENQLADTDHDHLGKIITYAAGKSADVIVWIVKRARDEHRQAIEWLNQRTDENIAFFLIEIELWRIGDSLPAPKFKIVEKPNEWAKSIKVLDGLSETKQLQLQFWQSFNDYAFAKKEFKKHFRQRKAHPQHWYDLSIGSSEYHIAMSANTQKKVIGTELYINDNKEFFEKLRARKESIEQFFGAQLIWREAEKACRILIEHPGDIKQPISTWPSLFEWFCAMDLKFKEMVQNNI